MPDMAQGGLWIDPNGGVHEVASHAPFAYDVLMNGLIGEGESKKLELTDDGSSVEWKGSGGAEAKYDAQSQMAGRSREDHKNSEELRGQGWIQVRIGDGKAFVFADSPEIVASAWNTLGPIMEQSGGMSFGIGNQVSHASTYLTGEEIDSAEGGVDSLLQLLRSRSSVNKSGLGPWLSK